MSKLKISLFAAAALASALSSAPAYAVPLPRDMVPLMDTSAPKYATPECEQAREAAKTYDGGDAADNVAAAMIGANFGLIGAAFAGAAAGAAQEQRLKMFVEHFVQRCGEEAFVPFWQSQAEKGDDDAAARLGRVYAHKEDWPQAIRWYQAAVDHGNTMAEAGLGAIYAHGNGVPADRAHAVQLWQHAADHGSIEAQRSLGQMYVEDQNYAKAIELYRAAAMHYDGASAFYLAGLYEQGLGVARNDRAAFGWYGMAALQLYPGAVDKRGAVAARLTPGQLDDGIKNVERCFRSRSCDFD